MTTTTPRPPVTPVARLRARGRLRGGLPLLGPAFVAAIAYVDPGNFATNTAAGSVLGNQLLWVVVLANLVAVLVQNLSAKLGLATGRSLPELCRERFSRRTTRVLWGQAELVAIATDLAELIGGAVALNLLFGLPLVQGGLVTAVVSMGLLALQTRGHRRFELVVTGLFAVILLGFLVDLVRADPDPGAVAAGLLPSLGGPDALLLATGIIGATVMPHVVYLHSAMTSRRTPTHDDAEKRHLLRHQRWDIALAMGLAGLVNAAMLVLAAALFHDPGGAVVDTLEGAHAGLALQLDDTAALLFALALLASGFASAGVGTYAGQVVMTGFLRRRVPLAVRRGVTLVPALAVLAAGVDPTRALVVSQVVLSFGIPFALVPLVLLTRDRALMGTLVNRRRTTVAATVATVVVGGLNAVLVLRVIL